MNDYNQAITFCKVYYFADDTSLLNLGKSTKKISKLVNIDLKCFVNWVNAKNISLSLKNTENALLKSKRKIFQTK